MQFDFIKDTYNEIEGIKKYISEVIATYSGKVISKTFGDEYDTDWDLMLMFNSQEDFFEFQDNAEFEFWSPSTNVSECNTVIIDDKEQFIVRVWLDLECMTSIKVWPNEACDTEVRKQFEDLISETGFELPSGTVTHYLHEAISCDEIAVNQAYSAYVDSRVTDGDLPQCAVNYAL